MSSFPTRIFLNGEFCRSSDGETIPQINPATEEFLAEVSAASLGDAHNAVKGAHRAFGDWAEWIHPRRAEMLRHIAQGIRNQADALARLESLNVGKPVGDARREVQFAAEIFDYYSGAIGKLFGQTIPVTAGGLDLTLREPLGVVTVIAAWNYPFLNACIKTAPALAAGNTVILKPSSRSPLTALGLGTITAEAGLPPGVLQILPGVGGEIGEALVSHPLVRRISFTGSSEVGARLMARAAGDLKRVSLELSGKCPNIIFADADVETAAAAAVAGAFGNAGQSNAARARVFVESVVYDRFLECFLERARAFRLGDPLAETTQMGPLISREQLERVEGFLEEARRAGRTVAQGGTRPSAKGHYLEPSILLQVEDSDPVWAEEIFGPVACVRAFEEETEVLAAANDSPYAMAASVWTSDLQRALRMARRLQAGSVSVNSHQIHHLEAPYGGSKHSGLGRHLGLAGLEEQTELKNIFLAD